MTDENEPEINPQQIEITPKRTHYTKTETETIQGLVNEGYSSREIATKMDRTLSGIRNLRRRLALNSEAERRLPTLRDQVKNLEEKIIYRRITLALLEDQILRRKAKIEKRG